MGTNMRGQGLMAVAVTGWRWGMADSECALELGLRVAEGCLWG